MRPCVRPWDVCSHFSNIDISETSGPMTIKFYPKHHWGGEKPALGFGPHRIRTLVSMATDNYYMVIMIVMVIMLLAL